MTAMKPRRSVLYMPGSNARALEKGRTLSADALIFDLEDGVAPDAKGPRGSRPARPSTAAAMVRARSSCGSTASIRPGARMILLPPRRPCPTPSSSPRCRIPEALSAIGLRLRRLGVAERIRVWAMIETPLAVLNAGEIASAAHDVDARLDCFVLGTNDLAKETRARLAPGRAAILPWLMTAVAAARAFDLGVIDGVYNVLADEAGFRAECEQGRDCGFDGKTLIHPGQIAAANEAFSPTQDEVDEARAIVAAFARPENAGKGAIALEGRMVERLHAEMAKRIAWRLREADRRTRLKGSIRVAASPPRAA